MSEIVDISTDKKQDELINSTKEAIMKDIENGEGKFKNFVNLSRNQKNLAWLSLFGEDINGKKMTKLDILRTVYPDKEDAELRTMYAVFKSPKLIEAQSELSQVFMKSIQNRLVSISERAVELLEEAVINMSEEELSSKDVIKQLKDVFSINAQFDKTKAINVTNNFTQNNTIMTFEDGSTLNDLMLGRGKEKGLKNVDDGQNIIVYDNDGNLIEEGDK